MYRSLFFFFCAAVLMCSCSNDGPQLVDRHPEYLDLENYDKTKTYYHHYDQAPLDSTLDIYVDKARGLDTTIVFKNFGAGAYMIGRPAECDTMLTSDEPFFALYEKNTGVVLRRPYYFLDSYPLAVRTVYLAEPFNVSKVDGYWAFNPCEKTFEGVTVSSLHPGKLGIKVDTRIAEGEYWLYIGGENHMIYQEGAMNSTPPSNPGVYPSPDLVKPCKLFSRIVLKIRQQ